MRDGRVNILLTLAVRICRSRNSGVHGRGSWRRRRTCFLLLRRLLGELFVKGFHFIEVLTYHFPRARAGALHGGAAAGFLVLPENGGEFWEGEVFGWFSLHVGAVREAFELVVGGRARAGGVAIEMVVEEEVGGGGVGRGGGVAGGGGGGVGGGGGGGRGEEEGADHGEAGGEVEGEELTLVEELVGGAEGGGGFAWG